MRIINIFDIKLYFKAYHTLSSSTEQNNSSSPCYLEDIFGHTHAKTTMRYSHAIATLDISSALTPERPFFS